MHVLRMEGNNDCRMKKEWQPEGKVGRPTITWRRTVKKSADRRSGPAGPKPRVSQETDLVKEYN